MLLPITLQFLWKKKRLFGTQISGNKFILFSVHREIHQPQIDLLKLFLTENPSWTEKNHNNSKLDLG